MDEDSKKLIKKLTKECEDLKTVVEALETQLDAKKFQYKVVCKRLKDLKKAATDAENKQNIELLANNLDSEWTNKEFPWKDKVKELLVKKFCLNKFRPKQLAAINVTLSKKDVLIVMPTGGGKSLIYQLAALVDKGLTIVVSPLISLIEDQTIALKKLEIKAASINSSTSKTEVKVIYDEMGKSNANLKLLYVTPEWIGKSKRFLSVLKKAYESGLIARVAIDEVHCCSTWGHDFRPDYGYLGILRSTLPKVPFIGLTATATMSVLTDVQNMLSMEGCMIITAPFNRPNLYYKVVPKHGDQEPAEIISDWIRTKYLNESGIIYVTTVSECTSLVVELRKFGLKAAPYHAQMEADTRQKVHLKWIEKIYQVVVATIAFGMGIDKADVRFVIHYSMPRSMEGLYQESGRAGRDGNKADCIVMFSLNDYLKVLSLANSLSEEEKTLSVLKYCLDNFTRSLIASHFEELWNPSHCNNMCDHCNKDNEYCSKNLIDYDMRSACKSLHKLIKLADSQDEKLTLTKLLDSWFQRGPKKLRDSSIRSPTIARNKAEKVVAHLLLDKYLIIDKGYNSYSTICYIQVGKSIDDYPLLCIKI